VKISIDRQVARKSISTKCSLSLALVLAACATAEPVVYNAPQIQSISTWRIDFLYQPGEVQERQDAQGATETRVTTGGRRAEELQLRDDIRFRLQDHHGVTIATGSAPEAGSILIHPVRAPWNAFRSTAVEIRSPDGETLARVRVRNGDRNATIKEDDAFAVFVADAIGQIVRSGRTR
jgi:hypothetical protein